MAVTDDREALLWRPGSRKFRLLGAILATLFVGYAAVYLTVSFTSGSPHAFGDSFALWSWGRFAIAHPAAAIYDPAELHRAQIGLGMPADDEYPFAYPPSFLLVLWPMGLLPHPLAGATLTLGSLALFLWATLGREWRLPALLTVLAMPTTTIAIVSGQSGFLAGAMLAGGLRLAASRPLLAGILFGLLTYKPQLGLLVPVALAAARLWRTLAAASLTALALVCVTTALFGSEVWAAWLAALPQYSRQFAAQSGDILHLMPTVLAGLLRLGISPGSANTVQWAAFAASAAIVWALFRHGATPLAGAALMVATFLATPYAFVYDMPLLAAAVIWIVEERRRDRDAFTSLEMLILMLAAVFPMTMPSGTSHFPLAPTILALLLGLIAARLWRGRRPAVAALPAQ
ncbi:MAG: DUF2029 domain-containing protein [Alphaproteobacteria bacterium]|nr:DUF2029 domain-containing protein [Alphaproteobacteria bacterium]MBV9151001.1 DUF2029 domain-containing protein [Alphaproteobacteria bacterium]